MDQQADSKLYQHPFAGFLIRLIASCIDSVIMLLVISVILFSVVGLEVMHISNHSTSLLWAVLFYGFPITATIGFWVFVSATPGKMLFNIKVVDAKTNAPPSLRQAVLRYCGYVFSALPLGLGFLWVIWDKKNKAGTISYQELW